MAFPHRRTYCTSLSIYETSFLLHVSRVCRRGVCSLPRAYFLYLRTCFTPRNIKNKSANANRLASWVSHRSSWCLHLQSRQKLGFVLMVGSTNEKSKLSSTESSETILPRAICIIVRPSPLDDCGMRPKILISGLYMPSVRNQIFRVVLGSIRQPYSILQKTFSLRL